MFRRLRVKPFTACQSSLALDSYVDFKCFCSNKNQQHFFHDETPSAYQIVFSQIVYSSKPDFPAVSCGGHRKQLILEIWNRPLEASSSFAVITKVPQCRTSRFVRGV